MPDFQTLVLACTATAWIIPWPSPPPEMRRLFHKRHPPTQPRRHVCASLIERDFRLGLKLHFSAMIQASISPCASIDGKTSSRRRSCARPAATAPCNILTPRHGPRDEAPTPPPAKRVSLASLSPPRIGAPPPFAAGRRVWSAARFACIQCAKPLFRVIRRRGS
jgi:hypothetical protein